MPANRQLRVYTTPTCPYCRMVKDWLREQGCSYEEHVITTDVEALREWRRISGGVGVPVTTFGEDLVVGFDPERLQQFVRSCRNSSPFDISVDADSEK